jgi:hypothetical protein
MKTAGSTGPPSAGPGAGAGAGGGAASRNRSEPPLPRTYSGPGRVWGPAPGASSGHASGAPPRHESGAGYGAGYISGSGQRSAAGYGTLRSPVGAGTIGTGGGGGPASSAKLSADTWARSQYPAEQARPILAAQAKHPQKSMGTHYDWVQSAGPSPNHQPQLRQSTTSGPLSSAPLHPVVPSILQRPPYQSAALPSNSVWASKVLLLFAFIFIMTQGMYFVGCWA